MVSFDWLSLAEFECNETATISWLSSVAESEGYVLEELAVVFCTDEELLEFNKKYLNHDYFTDIITFDYCEEGRLLGDLFISVERVEENAREIGVMFHVELDRVMVHGLLHLCGFGDKTENEALVMRHKENVYLEMKKSFI